MSSTLIHIFTFIIVSIDPYYSKYYDEQNITFIYHRNDGDLIDTKDLSISTLNNKLHVLCCDDEKQSFNIKQNISYHLAVVFKNNMLQVTLNDYIVCHKTCQIITDHLRNTNLQAMLITKNTINSKHARHLLAINTTNSTIKPTMEKATALYKWYEIWKLEWWTDHWSPTKFIIVVTISVVILASILIVITCCICRCCKKRKKKRIKRQPIAQKTKCNSSIKRRSHSSIKRQNYNKLSYETETEIETENEMPSKIKVSRFSTTIVCNNKQYPSAEQIELIQRNRGMSRSRQSRSRGNSQVTEEVKVNNINENKQHESSSDSEDLFGDGGTGGGTQTPFHDTVMTINDTHTFGSDTLTSTMDKASLKGSMKAADMTAGSLKSFSGQQIIEIKEDSLQENDNGDHGEGFVYDKWLKDTLQELFPKDWINILSHFRKQRITEDVLISMNTDKETKSEIWKELLPKIGDRIRFQKAWNDELMRRQLCRRT